MLKRTISGSVYVALIVGFFLLRNVDARFFQIFIAFLCAVGTFEVARAERKFTSNFVFFSSIVLGSLGVPFYCLIKYCFKIKFALPIMLGVCLFTFIIALIVCIAKKKNKQEIFANVLAYVYPIISLLLICEMNDFVGAKGFISLLLLFVISPCSDTMAYLTGMIYGKIKKGNVKKLCPNLSPKKTVAGAIGGLVGGGLAGLICYLIFKGQIFTLGLTLPIVWFIMIGVVGSILTQAGDLFESYVKRKVNIKDMGKIMPGHGGVMDRIDGTLFLSVFLFVVFLLI